MSKFHLMDNGLPGACTAKAGKCPKAAAGDHYDTKLEALVAAEQKLLAENELFASQTKKEQIWHLSNKGAVEECRFRDGYCEAKPYGKYGNVHTKDKVEAESTARALREIQARYAAEAPPVAKKAANAPKKRSASSSGIEVSQEDIDEAAKKWPGPASNYGEFDSYPYSDASASEARRDEAIQKEAERIASERAASANSRGERAPWALASPPASVPAPKPKKAVDPVTTEARKMRGDFYDSYRREGWTEAEIQSYKDSCGHSGPPARFRTPSSRNSC